MVKPSAAVVAAPESSAAVVAAPASSAAVVAAPGPGAVRWVAGVIDVAGALERALDSHDVGRLRRGVWEGMAGDAYAAAHQRFLRQMEARVAMLRLVARAGEQWLRDPALGEAPFVWALRHAAGAPGRELFTLRAAIPRNGTPPDQVVRWWSSLTLREQLWIEALAGPGLGALGGVPLIVRDRVNRVTLSHDLAVDRRSAGVKKALEPRAGGRTWLVEYARDSHGGDGTAVIGVGDLERASRLAVIVPGVGTESSDAPRGLERARAVQTESGAGTAVIWWLDYDAPDSPRDPTILTDAAARRGGNELLADLAGIQETRDTGRGQGGVRTTLIGHSYGAATVAAGLSEVASQGSTHTSVDAVVLAGAPGAAGAAHAVDLGVDEVYVARDSRDAVADLGSEGRFSVVGTLPGLGLGIDPSAEEFGAVRLRAERSERGGLPSWGEAHGSYFTPGSESLTGIAAVVRGEVAGEHVAEPRTDPWWRSPHDPERGREVLPG